MELRGRPGSGRDHQESYLRRADQGLCPPCDERSPPVLHQKRQDGPRRNSQRLSASAFEIAAENEQEEFTDKAQDEALSGAPRIGLSLRPTAIASRLSL